MKKLFQSLLLLLLGLAGGYYLGITYPDSADLPLKWKNSLAFLKPAETPVVESLDTLIQKRDTLQLDTVTPVTAALSSCWEGADFKEALLGYASRIEARRFAYRADLGQDCSGIFHKMKDSIAIWASKNCQEKYQYPDYAQTRSSRHIADWYYQRGNLKLVEDPMEFRNSIAPGAVMFYAKPGNTYRSLTIEMLTGRSQNYNPSQAAIMHIGIVVDVTRDEQGNVVQYTLMHGRNEKYPASRTDFHKEVQSRSNPNLPKFGNWSQQWVAIAEVATNLE